MRSEFVLDPAQVSDGVDWLYNLCIFKSITHERQCLDRVILKHQEEIWKWDMQHISSDDV